MSSIILSSDKTEDIRLFIELAQRLGVKYSIPSTEITQPKSKKKRKYGFAKGAITYIAPDFDETPPGFEEYMPQNMPI